jgi:hypothetical protein
MPNLCVVRLSHRFQAFYDECILMIWRSISFFGDTIMGDVVVDQNKTDETTDWDDVSFLDEMELGEVDPESYQEQDDDGCEGGACKI